MSICDDSVDDIEDLVNVENFTNDDRVSNVKNVRIRYRIKSVPSKNEAVDAKTELSNIPGCGRIFIKTWGCTHNNSDSEYMAGILSSYGFEIVQDKMLADLWLLNSCTVKNPAEDHFRNEINSAKKLGKFLVLAGCVPQGEPKNGLVVGFSIIGVQQIDRIVEVVEETLNGNIVRLYGVRKENGKKIGGAPLNLPKIRRNPFIEIIAINTGCLNQCTYCKTKHARGNLGSYPIDDIVQRASQAFLEGVVELWLTSEDTGTYGRDIGTNLPTLLWKLIDVIPDGCRLRLGMTNPPYILEHVEEMVKILNHPKIYKFLHIPVQSGSDFVLTDMKREYCRSDFEFLVDFLKERVKGITIATDIICGFPTETDADFQETMTLCQKYKFPSLFINQFYGRPGTPAYRMPKLDSKIIKTRTKQLSDWFRSYEPYGHKLHYEFMVLFTETMPDKQLYVGHNEFYEQILVPFEKFEQSPLGKMIRVRIIECTKFSMIAEPIKKLNWFAVMVNYSHLLIVVIVIAIMAVIIRGF